MNVAMAAVEVVESGRCGVYVWLDVVAGRGAS
jgi:hypothetical protein